MSALSIRRARCRWLGSAMALLMAGELPAQSHDVVTSTCTADKSATVSTATAALEGAPVSLDKRLRLADALLEAGCYDAAVHVLEAGEQFHPHSSELQNRLRTTRSMQTEQNYFAGLESAEIAARLQRNQLRCARLGDIAACDEALKLQPDNVDTLSAKADALLNDARPAEALTIYRRASDLGGDPTVIQSKITAANTQRQALLTDCQSLVGAGALQACRAALLPGAEDEFLIRKRNGVLLQAANRPEEALNEFIAASSIRHDDQAVALAVVALSASVQRKDAAAMAALGAAQLTLGKPQAAVGPLRQAQALAPGIPDIHARLAMAERLAKGVPKPAAQLGEAATPVPVLQQLEPAVVPERTRTYSNIEPEGRMH